jgi:RHH-type proline utilization regulon transcriptional repressor/proline dehydrogenase/delta 1-pyrroline-5-carboxylate dehydrogenase
VDATDAATGKRLRLSAASYRLRMQEEFGRSHDHFQLLGQDNLRRYWPVGQVRIRSLREDSAFELFARVAAARAARCSIIVSSPPGGHHPQLGPLQSWTDPWAGAIEFVEESDETLSEIVRNHQTDRVRYADDRRVPRVLRRAAAAAGAYLATAPVLMEGRIELLHYLREQSVCVDYHRYGNLGARAGEARAPVL